MALPDDGLFPNLHVYLPSPEHRTGKAVLILPGGAYAYVSSAKEGHRPAQLLNAHGIAAAVLEYRHAPRRHPVPLMDAQRGLRVLRHWAETQGLNTDQVGVMGFSAGGHLAGSLASQPVVTAGRIGDTLDSVAFRPDFAALIYPVVSFTATTSHFGSRDNLLGKSPDPALVEALSLENAITPETPPMFLVHAQDDQAVSPANSIALFEVLTRHQVPAELHIYPEGGHGFGLAANHPWGELLLRWLSRS
ncbi:MAG: alpha/beta hydrolase [Verrucomicrobia bacterium]|nr:alpha/beta hydrolase [Verrucomicrobiota bacterium]MCH8510299.1 alpha/beta hydrolase [Kiritimatiellia bacterium]